MFAFGISAALAAPLVMTLGFIVWDNHWKGSAFALNLFKCNLASMVFVVLSLTTRRGDVFPDQVFTLQKVGFLMLSSTIGIIIGDWTWLEGLKLLGARRVIVVDTCKPFLAALLGWAFLGENLRPPAFGGMALTVGGVLLVSWEEAKEEEEEEETTYSTKEVGCADSSPTMTTPLPSEENSLPQTQECTGDNEEEEQRTFDLSGNGGEDDHAGDERIEEEKVARSEGRTKTASDLRRGYTMSVLNVVLDTFGSLLTKEYGVGMTVWEIGLIRFGFAGVVMLAVSALLSAKDAAVAWRTDEEKQDDNTDSVELWYRLPRNMSRRSWVQIVVGVGLVTFLTPSLSNYALFQIALALALTLGSVGPLYALPLTWWLQSERPTARACLGALGAVAGIVVLSFWGTL